MKKNKEVSFNQKLERLNEISQILDNDSLDVETAIALYEEGTALAAECLEALKKAELTITKLQNKTVPGKPVAESPGTTEE